MRWNVKLSFKNWGESCYWVQFIEFHEHYVRIGSKLRIPAGFDFLFDSNEVDLEKAD